MKSVVERRLELLKMEAIGFSESEIVKELSVKYRKTERTLWYDFETRRTWQPLFSQLFDRAKSSLVILNRLEFIYRTASLKGDYKAMLDATRATIEFLGLSTSDLNETFNEKRETFNHNVKQLTELLLDKGTQH